MDTNYEYKLYRQIEKSLSNNVNDRLLVPIEMIDGADSNGAVAEYKENEPRLSRAEYILQEREACLRQMNSIDATSRVYNSYVGADDSIYSTFGKRKKDKVENLFNEGDDEALPEEIASFRSLIIRTVCAVVIFLSIFIIDKVKMDLGKFSYETIRQYVTGYNQLNTLEELIVSLLK